MSVSENILQAATSHMQVEREVKPKHIQVSICALVF